MTKHIIVARYNEDLNWLNSIDQSFTKIVYNKGPKANLDTEISLENVGRESHTYLYHLANNYDSLADLSVFCQGNPIAHCYNFIEQVNTLQLNEDEGFKWITSNLFDSDQFGKPHHHISIDIQNFLHRTNQVANIPTSMKFAPGAQFAVTKKTITNKPKSYYENLLNEYVIEKYDQPYKDNDVRDNRQFNQFYHFGAILERAWEVVFKN